MPEVALGPRRAVDRAEHAPLHPRDRQRRQRQLGVRARDADQHRRAARRGSRGTPPASPRAGRSPRSRSRRRRPTPRATASAVASAIAGPEHPVPSRRTLGAASSLLDAASTAITGSAPTATAAITAERPTPPQPITATRSPGRTPAVRQTAPTPVVTAQPTRPATSNGTSLRDRDARALRARRTPRRTSRGTSSGRRARRRARAASCRPSARRCPSPARRSSRAAAGRAGTRAHAPHDGTHESATWSPTTTRVTPGPDRLDDAGALVAEHGRAARLGGAVDRVQVGVADAARVQAHEHLAGPRRGELELLHLRAARRCLEHGGADLHGAARLRVRLARPARLEPAQLARAGCGSASGGRLDLDERRLGLVADRARSAAGSGCGRRSRTAGRPRSGSRPRA